MELAEGLKVLNVLFDIKFGPQDSYILKTLASIFSEGKGLTDSLEQTSWTPEKQTKGLLLKDITITKEDPYHSKNKKAQFDVFLKGAQDAVKRNNLEDLLMRLFSQLIKPSILKNITDVIDFAELIEFSDLDSELKVLRKNILIYKVFITSYNVNLIEEIDEKNIKLSLVKKPGSIPYLAKIAHSLSHTKLWNKEKINLAKELKGSFSGRANPKYQK